MKASVLIPLLALTLLVSCAQMSPTSMTQMGAAPDNHAALVKYYEASAKKAKAKLEDNKNILADLKAHPYYYGAQGLDLKAHSSANIQKCEKMIEGNLHKAELHRKLLIEQHSSIQSIELTETESERSTTEL